TILSFNLWSDVSIIGDKNFFESLDFLTANIMLPLGGLLMAVFFGWIMTKESIKQELNLTDSWMPVFLLVLKFVTPIAVAIVFVANFL
ncbi:MAG TPA: sodium-dependent transporter, partial [Thiomicrospira sp.]|nr:sodium-dependent transporter [Thiomicrospira sp.]